MFVVPASPLRFLLPLTYLVSVLNNRIFAANIFDWAPSISLTDNFGVMEGLCPDIAGFGASLNCDVIMQLHTCKARGDDTQFVFDFDSNVIRSVNYDPDCQSISDDKNGACITVDGSISEGDNLRLSPCNQGIGQSFELSMDGRIRTVANSNLCLAKTSDVGPAGPNERTDFALADCDGADPEDVTWTINPPMPPTPDVTEAPTTTPTDGGCMVKKEKFGYKKCTKLNKNKCATETLCVMNTVTDKCAHVCDDKEKSDCKKPTFKGKKMCTFQK